jgi:hypothetical protein
MTFKKGNKPYGESMGNASRIDGSNVHKYFQRKFSMKINNSMIFVALPFLNISGVARVTKLLGHRFIL